MLPGNSGTKWVRIRPGMPAGRAPSSARLTRARSSKLGAWTTMPSGPTVSLGNMSPTEFEQYTRDRAPSPILTS